MEINISKKECTQIAEVLSRRANEIAGFTNEYRSKEDHYGSVEMALTREMDRLRSLARKVSPPEADDDEYDD